MAIAPSKLGRVIRDAGASPERIIASLRARQLVEPSAADAEMRAEIESVLTFFRERPRGRMFFGGPACEDIRVCLAPFLTAKGEAWAVGMKSLDIPDDPVPRVWWRFWER